MGRMVVTLMACQFGVLDLPLLHVSAQIEKHKDNYVDLLFRVSTQGAWEEWVTFFLRIVELSCRAATEKVDQIIALERELKNRVREARRNHRLNALIEALFVRNWITAPEAQKICKSHFQTAQSDLQELTRLEILKVAYEGRPIVYYAPGIAALSNR
jgi:Fic family protein